MDTDKLKKMLTRLAMEPPFRMLAWGLFHVFKPSARTRAVWSIGPRHMYLLGVVTAAELATKQQVPSISVIEFGVAGGKGLLALQEEAAAVENELGVEIKVYGFDAGGGLPHLIGDYRDHPDIFRPGDYPMDEDALRSRLTSRTTLILGHVAETVGGFFDKYDPPPIGFASFDLDLYSSTRDALKIFTRPNKRMLRQVPLYFDDIDQLQYHKFAGELLAIEEFNQENSAVKIDRWYGVRREVAFPERSYLDQLFVAHDLDAISQTTLNRDIEQWTKLRS
ncbi:MAG: hypothetical protein ACRD8U_08460 [Pyrinomonadaceae bacterium]